MLEQVFEKVKQKQDEDEPGKLDDIKVEEVAIKLRRQTEFSMGEDYYPDDTVEITDFINLTNPTDPINDPNVDCDIDECETEDFGMMLPLLIIGG